MIVSKLLYGWFESAQLRNMEENIFLKNGTLFATGYNRIVHGERGDYVEFEKEHIIPKLVSKFGNKPTDNLDIYYWWLTPVTDKNTKVYLQKKTVKYADYKIGKYYVSPYLLKNFKDPEQLFPYDIKWQVYKGNK